MLQLNGLQRYSFGLFIIAFLLLVFSTSFAGCHKKEQFSAYSPTTLMDTNRNYQRFSYLALGDRYTIGRWVPEECRFPLQAVSRLGIKGMMVNKTDLIAMMGWTTQNLLNGIANARQVPVITWFPY